MLTTLFVSFGAPLLLASDEMGRSQGGNNNAYCQDNELAWVDWDEPDKSLLRFTQAVISLRAQHPVLRRRRHLTGAEADEIAWFSPDGTAMTPLDWANPEARCVAVHLGGSDGPDHDESGELLVDADLLLLFNGWSDPVDFVLPQTRPGACWSVELDSARSTLASPPGTNGSGSLVVVAGRSVQILSSPAPHPTPGSTLSAHDPPRRCSADHQEHT